MTIKTTSRFFPTLVLVLATVFVTACVTTTDSRFSREADKQEAIDRYVKLATAYIAQGSYDRAKHHLDRALEIDSKNPAALAAMGLVLNAEGEEDLAEASFKRAISEDGGYTRGRVYYGAFLYGQGNIEGARDQFQIASRDTNYQERGSVFFNLGMTQERLGEQADAANSYRRSVELSRGDARSLLSLSRVLVEQGDWEAAARYYDRLILAMQKNQSLSHSPESLLLGIRIARHQNDHNREASLALQLKNNYPESAEYQQYRGLRANGQ
ncbi:MAG TPA: type IV pilus biogenesis/stability protein PilW [Marinobacter sp.]|nr:type IV pilus biogenesis/stability protein PilW [Marinobacter sp.]